MSKYGSFCNFNSCNLFLKLDKSCLLKDMINHRHPSRELIALSFLNAGTQKFYDTVLNADLEATTIFIEISLSLNNLMKGSQILCWMQLQKKIKNLNLWLSFKMRLNCNCIEDIR